MKYFSFVSKNRITPAKQCTLLNGLRCESEEKNFRKSAFLGNPKARCPLGDKKKGFSFDFFFHLFEKIELLQPRAVQFISLLLNSS